MKVSFVYYSNTGHTSSVAAEAAKRLSSIGVETTQIDVVRDEHKEIPADVDGMVFMTPVNAFSLPQQMTDFFAGCPALKQGTPAVVFVNQGLWTPVLGGNRTARQLTEAVQALGCVVKDVTIVSWNKKRVPKIEAFLSRLTEVFS